MVQVTRNDMQMMLVQIKIAEQNAAGTPLDQLILNPDLPYGLRTTSGINNNITGTAGFGQADLPFPSLTAPTFKSAGPSPAGFVPAQATSSYAQTSGFVFDSAPRTISNLIVDQSSNNPAAVASSSNPGASGSLPILNINPIAGLPPANSYFTFFGQFFDHGLDLTSKGGSGLVVIPVLPGDPLYVAGSPNNFMVLNRATNGPGADGILGTADDVRVHINQDTPFIDQSQTYTSSPSHQVFLREYVLNAAGKPVATGKMMDHAGGGLATWADVKTQAHDLLGITLTDLDVGRVPLVVTDDYGRFLPGANGFPQLVTGPNTTTSGTPANPVNAATALASGHAFLDDISHNAAPTGFNQQGNRVNLTPDADTVVNATTAVLAPGTYDNELLDRHFATGDSRGNENIGLTSIHQVFHDEHNGFVDQMKVFINTQDAAFQADWKLPDGSFNGERLLQAARFNTEMQYQHIVFEEFVRTISPAVPAFSGYNFTIRPDIVAEFANAVYRFGHSMLTDTVARINADGTHNDITLLDAFLNPVAYADGGLTPLQEAGAIARGMSMQISSQIDEFVVGAVRNTLLGQPLDLAALNIARGRDVGIPTLQGVRKDFSAVDSSLTPYTSWVDYGLGLTHPASLVNFVAAYGTHSSIISASTDATKRAAADLLVFGGAGAPLDRLAFMNSTGAWANDLSGATITGMNDVDFWIGGLAERPAAFAGLLGPTFNFVFQDQMTKLQDGDRLYYLARTPGMNLGVALEETSLADLVMSHSDATHLYQLIFLKPDFVIEAGNPASDPAGLVTRLADGTVRFTGLTQEIVLGGTSANDHLIGGGGNDAIYGDAGDDILEGRDGADTIAGGAGNDTLLGGLGADVLKGGDGNDSLDGGPGANTLFGDNGDDFLSGGPDGSALNGGSGNDILVGGAGADALSGNEGDDWLEGGSGNDALAGDNGNPFGNSLIIGNDVLLGGSGDDNLNGENGDDIMLGGPGGDLLFGRQGFDWASYDGEAVGAVGVVVDLTLDANVAVLPTDPSAGLDRFFQVEAVSGSAGADIIRGSAENTNTMNAGQIGLITGLAALLGGTSFTGGNILLGGAGSDVLEGRGGNDFIDGKDWMQVSLSSRAPGGVISRVIVTRAAGVNEVDTAVYSDIAANYDVSTVGGLTTVAHLRGTLADGIDTLKNIDIVKFANTTINLTGNNLPATGTVTVTGTPTENQVLTASTANIADPNGVDFSTLAIHWQALTAVNTWTEVGLGNTFIPGNPVVGQQLRAQATFTDGVGAQEALTSGPTVAIVNVNDVPTGAPLLSSLVPAKGTALQASQGNIADADGLTGVTFSYQWQSSSNNGVSFTDIAGANTANFTPVQAQVNTLVRVVVTYTDNHGTVEHVSSLATAVVAEVFVGTPNPDNPTLTAAADSAQGLGGNDTLNGLGGNDTLDGGAGNDSLNGGDGIDLLTGGAGDDVIDGGLGTDTATYSGVRANYFATIVGGTVTLQDLRGPATGDGTDTLVSVENFKFADGTVQTAALVAGNPPPPATPISLSLAGGVSLNEGNAGTTNFTFTVNRDIGSGTGATTANWAVSAGASNPANAVDFIGAALPSGTVSFAANQASATVTVAVQGDTTVELNESFTVTLSAAAGGPNIGTATAIGTIVNDDGAPPPPPPGGTTTELGAGADLLALKITQDAYQGSAQFDVSVDGVKVNGAPLSVNATSLHGGAVSDTVNIHGDYAGGQHSVTVNFLNDLFGGTAATDRNLYVDGITFDDEAVAGGPVVVANGVASLLSSGPKSFAFIDVTPGGNPGTGTNTNLGSGADTLVVKLTQDAYLGNAQFDVSVDGVKVNGAPLGVSAGALHGSAVFDTVTLHGDYAGGQHNVTVNFLNDAWGGTAATDRNLYVDGITFDDEAVVGGAVAVANSVAALMSAGPKNFAFTDVTPGANPGTGTSTNLGSGTDTLVLKITQDAYLGNAQYNVSVDGVVLNLSPLIASAASLHGSAVFDTVTVHGNFAGGVHNVAVNFLNDAWGGTAATDRNLYVDGITFDDDAVVGGAVALPNSTAALLSQGAVPFAFTDASAGAAPTLTLGSGVHTLLLQISQDFYLANAQFNISVDGVKLNASPISAGALHGSGQEDTIAVLGNFAAGNHTVSVTFLNDAYAGTPQTDRNLYVDALAYDNVGVPGASAALVSAGTADFIFH